MSKTKITTYSPEDFRRSYIKPEKQLDTLLKPDFHKFFLVKVEDLIRHMKLPVPPVRTTNHTLLFLTQGKATMRVGGERHKIGKNECLFVPAGQVYSFDKYEKNKGYLCNFHVNFIIGKFGTSELINDFEFFKVWGNPRVKLGVETAKHVEYIFKRLLREYADNGLKNAGLLQPYLISLLTEVRHAYKALPVNSSLNSISIANRFKEILFAHFRTVQKVSEYASLLNVSPNHLNKLVRTVTGKSPTKWIDEAIVMEAKVLLHQTDIKVNEVALEVGIVDQSYFSRLFKKYEGVTPLAYRRRIEKSLK